MPRNIKGIQFQLPWKVDPAISTVMGRVLFYIMKHVFDFEAKCWRARIYSDTFNAFILLSQTAKCSVNNRVISLFIWGNATVEQQMTLTKLSQNFRSKWATYCVRTNNHYQVSLCLVTPWSNQDKIIIFSEEMKIGSWYNMLSGYLKGGGATISANTVVCYDHLGKSFPVTRIQSNETDNIVSFA